MEPSTFAKFGAVFAMLSIALAKFSSQSVGDTSKR
jgi:hypothetical protein